MADGLLPFTGLMIRADLETQNLLDRLAREMAALIAAEAGQNGVEEGRRMAVGAILGGLRWLEGMENGPRHVASLLRELHETAEARVALREGVAASEVKQ